MFDHISIGVSELERSAQFYTAALAPLGIVVVHRNPRSVCYAPEGFEGEAPFAIIAIGDHVPTAEWGFHMAFAASNREEVDGFHRAALAAGGNDDGPPGIRENYDPGYYAAFVIDPDGHRLEAVLHE